jgi:hypothetical protein
MTEINGNAVHAGLELGGETSFREIAKITLDCGADSGNVENASAGAIAGGHDRDGHTDETIGRRTE